MKRVRGLLPVLAIFTLIFVGAVVDRFVPWLLYSGGVAVSGAGGRDDHGIFLFNIRGHALTRLTPRTELAYRPTWSPDGRRLAYLYAGEDHMNHIGLFDTVEGTSRAVVLGQREERPYIDLDGTLMAWSPDGTHILFNADPLARDQPGTEDLYLVDVGTGELEALSLSLDISQRRTFAMSWAPSEKLAVEVDSRIYLIELETARVVFLTEGSRPFWRPDASMLAYLCNRSGWGFCLIKADGSGEQVIYRDDGLRHLVADGSSLSWSRDGRFIAFMQGRGERPAMMVWVDTSTGLAHDLYASGWLDEVVIDQVALAPR